MDYIRRLDDNEIEAYLSAICANEHRKQLLYVPMSEQQAREIQSKKYNCLLIENPVFAQHDAMIAASRKQHEERLRGKKVGS